MQYFGFQNSADTLESDEYEYEVDEIVAYKTLRQWSLDEFAVSRNVAEPVRSPYTLLFHVGLYSS